jgi:hypothetical protein
LTSILPQTSMQRPAQAASANSSPATKNLLQRLLAKCCSGVATCEQPVLLRRCRATSIILRLQRIYTTVGRCIRADLASTPALGAAVLRHGVQHDALPATITQPNCNLPTLTLTRRTASYGSWRHGAAQTCGATRWCAAFCCLPCPLLAAVVVKPLVVTFACGATAICMLHVSTCE